MKGGVQITQSSWTVAKNSRYLFGCPVYNTDTTKQLLLTIWVKLINTISIKFNIFIAGTFQGCLPGIWPLHGPKPCWKNSNNIISASFKLLLIVIDWRLFEVITIIIINVLCQLMQDWMRNPYSFQWNILSPGQFV